MGGIISSINFSLYHFYLQVTREVPISYFMLKNAVVGLARINRTKPGFHMLFHQAALKFGDKTAIIDAVSEKSITFRQIDEYASQVANFFNTEKPENCEDRPAIGFMCDNQLEYHATVYGLNRSGWIPALLNYKLKVPALQHCLKVANAKSLIVHKKFLADTLELENLEKIYVIGCESNEDFCQYHSSVKIINLADKITSSSKSFPTEYYKFQTLHDNQFYLYTSGTTGFPKAAKVNLVRCFLSTFACGVWGINVNKRTHFYNILPFYHMTGFVIGGSIFYGQGATMVTREKFSVSKFFGDVYRYNCEGFIYIGEIARYLLNHRGAETRANSTTKLPKITWCLGNGMPASIWEKFTEKYNVAKVCEFYGSSEGCSTLFNTKGEPRKVGFLNTLLPMANPVCIVKVQYDLEKEDPEPQIVRDPKTGYCIKTEPNEPGMVIGLIRTQGLQRFDGYTDKMASSKKILHDVFTKNDKYFVSGDLAKVDKLGWVEFCERTGDTFRWKGENVSCSETETIVNDLVTENFDSEIFSTCVSCQIEGESGTAGLLCFQLGQKIEDFEYEKRLMAFLSEHLPKKVPAYQVPIFVRLVETIPVTGTFKIMKSQVKKEGFHDVLDPVYVFQKTKYELYDNEATYRY